MEAPNCARSAKFAAGLRLALAASAVCLAAAAFPTFADVLRILDDDALALAARRDVIQRARHSIEVSSFCIGSDAVALEELAELREAARRGIHVRIVVDGFNSRISPDVRDHLLDEGVEIKEFHPLHSVRPRHATRRLHDKLLIADAAEMITGGRNVESRYFGLDERNFVDRDVYVRGRVVGEARRYFDDLWQSPRVADARRTARRTGAIFPSATNSKREADTTVPAVRRLDEARIARRVPAEIQQCSLQWQAVDHCEVGSVQFWCDPAGDKQVDAAISENLIALLGMAKRSILIDTPYLVLSPAFDAALAAARDRGVHVRITTNSLVSTNKLLAQAGYEAQKGRLLAMGVELWEFNGPEVFHPKSFLIDDRIAVIGSFNLDPRSELRDTQVAIVADDPHFAARLRASMDQHLVNARLVSGEPGAVDATAAPQVAPRRRALFTFSRLVAPLIRDEL